MACAPMAWAQTYYEPSDSALLLFDDADVLGWSPWELRVLAASEPYITHEYIAEVAERIGVEPAAIHAVIEIEAGISHSGFWADGKPTINFDLAQFHRVARKYGINTKRYARSHKVVFERPNRKLYGSHQAAQQARLDAALDIDSVAAIEATFWGMFQIGGFNWKRCGAKSPHDFAKRMARSEREQLDLFVAFLENANLIDPLRRKDWHAFARGYNGRSYAARGYHTRLANAYAKHKLAHPSE